jgi:hypothetical protein
MNTTENDPQFKPDSEKHEPPTRPTTRMALSMPEWFRTVRAQRRLTPEEEKKLGAWFAQQLAGSPLEAGQYDEDGPEVK